MGGTHLREGRAILNDSSDLSSFLHLRFLPAHNTFIQRAGSPDSLMRYTNRGMNCSSNGTYSASGLSNTQGHSLAEEVTKLAHPPSKVYILKLSSTTAEPASQLQTTSLKYIGKHRHRQTTARMFKKGLT